MKLNTFKEKANDLLLLNKNILRSFESRKDILEQKKP